MAKGLPARTLLSERNESVIYVGRSGSVGERLKTHRRRMNLPHGVLVSIWETPCERGPHFGVNNNVGFLENSLIHRMQPQKNKCFADCRWDYHAGRPDASLLRPMIGFAVVGCECAHWKCPASHRPQVSDWSIRLPVPDLQDLGFEDAIRLESSAVYAIHKTPFHRVWCGRRTARDG